MVTPYHTWQHRGDRIYRTMKKPTISLVLATDGICNVACKTCPTGRNEREIAQADFMTLDMFKSIVDKAMNEAYVLSCCLYYFNEPMLHKNLPEMLQYLRD